MTNTDKKESNKKLDLIVKIVLIIIIILLLIHNCVLIKKRKDNGNVDIIDINCNGSQCNSIPKEINSLSFSANDVSVVIGKNLPLIVIIDPASLSDTQLSWTSSDPSVVSVDENGVVTGLKEGTAIITVTSPNGKIATCNVTVTRKVVNVKKINLNSNKLTMKVGSVKQLAATVEPKNATNRELVFSSSDPSIATVNNKGVISGLKEGTVTITVKTKDGKIVAKSVVKVEKSQKPKSIESLSFNEEKVSVKKGDSLNLVVVVKPSELSSSKLTWTSSDSSIVSVDENGKITGVKEGTATITVTSSNGKSATCQVTVTTDTIAVKEIVLNPKNVNLKVGETSQITSKVLPENATNRELVWSSSDPSVVTVDDKGVIKGIKAGTATITVKTKDGKVVSTVNATIENVPTPTPMVIESIKFNEEKVSVKKGDSLNLVVVVKPSELSSSKLTWTSSDSSIVSVDENGKITGVKEGTATITVTSSNGKSATCQVTVTTDTIAVEEIVLNPKNVNLKVGETSQITSKVLPENATNRELVWSSSDPSVVTVDDKGVIKGIKAGTATITVKTKDGKVVSTVNATIENVPTPTPMVIESIKFNEENVSLKKGDSLNLVVVVKPSELSSSKLTWTSSDSSIVSVDENGKITGIKEGTATITVTSSNGKSATCQVTVTTDTIEVEEIILDPTEINLEVGETSQITSRVLPENATNRELVWTSNDSNIVKVDNNGVIRALNPGTTTITVKTEDGKVVATVSVTVEDEPDLKAYDDDKSPIEWNGSSDLNIFSRSFYDLDGVIAPESSNTYKFVVRNSTGVKIKYNIYFHETNNFEINMKYKLRLNDTYIVDTYSKANTLDIYNYELNPGETDTYYLDWKWISSDNDTSIGQKPEANYGLRIEIEAESINE